MRLTNLTNILVFSADNLLNIVSNTIVADVLALEEVLSDDFFDLIFCLGRETVLLHIEVNDSLIR